MERSLLSSVVELQLFFTVPVLVLTIEKLRFRFRLLNPVPVLVPVPVKYLDHKRHSFQKNVWKKLFYKEKIDKFLQICRKM
jgi:hypothetical protein